MGQIEKAREMIGERGGVEALFLILEDQDTTMQANSLWALCNLMWYPPNQERAGRFMQEIIKFLKSEHSHVKSHAITLLANVLYYNHRNRVRFLESDGAMELLMSYVTSYPYATPSNSITMSKNDILVLENSLRSVLSLSYMDYVALWLGNQHHNTKSNERKPRKSRRSSKIDYNRRTNSSDSNSNTVGSPTNQRPKSKDSLLIDNSFSRRESNFSSYVELFIYFITEPFISSDVMKFSLEILSNLCVHHANRRLIMECDGTVCR
jgi:hypothetical protein